METPRFRNQLRSPRIKPSEHAVHLVELKALRRVLNAVIRVEGDDTELEALRRVLNAVRPYAACHPEDTILGDAVRAYDKLRQL